MGELGADWVIYNAWTYGGPHQVPTPSSSFLPVWPLHFVQDLSGCLGMWLCGGGCVGVLEYAGAIGRGRVHTRVGGKEKGGRAVAT